MIKRIFDFVASFFGLTLLSLLFLFIALWIKLDSKGPVFFRQQRVGLKGKIFKIHKFNTDIDFSYNGKGVGTFTKECKVNKIQISGGMLMNWGILEIKK